MWLNRRLPSRQSGVVSAGESLGSPHRPWLPVWRQARCSSNFQSCHFRTWNVVRKELYGVFGYRLVKVVSEPLISGTMIVPVESIPPLP